MITAALVLSRRWDVLGRTLDSDGAVAFMGSAALAALELSVELLLVSLLFA